ncbi:phosphoribosylpyrophosphate synthase [Gammaproteobacteria bacterium]|nr:phosphoribosylpyrophosphate synthase [Gammaproteobacteria bacterium]
MIFTGNANPELAKSVASYLNLNMGNATVGRFSDGEVNVSIDVNVRGMDVFVVQPTCFPTNDNIMELLVMADALRRASAMRITAVVPYFGYSRQDRRPRSARVPISAKVVANMITSVGFNRVLTIDLHADQIQGFFEIPVDNIYATPVILKDIQSLNEDFMIVSPDVGGVLRARALAKKLNDSDLAIIDKRRPGHNQAEVMHIIGDVKDRHCIIVDDMVDTAGTLCSAAKALKAKGAKSVRAYCTHPILSGKAIENITNSVLDEMIVTDTIPLQEASKNCSKLRVVGIAHLIAETISRIHQEESVSSLFL